VQFFLEHPVFTFIVVVVKVLTLCLLCDFIAYFFLQNLYFIVLYIIVQSFNAVGLVTGRTEVVPRDAA